MTREEAIAFGNRVIELGFKGETQAFCELAIKVLEQEHCEDAVSRKEVIDTITHWFSDMLETGKEEYSIDDVLNSLPSVTPTQRWIPVSERLPKIDGDYLLWGKVCEDEEEYQFIGSYDSGCEQFGIWEEQFDRTTLGCLGSEFFEYASVVAWMPLPLSYQGE